MEKLYKVLNADGTPCYDGEKRTWLLLSKEGPGAWMPPIRGKLFLCRNGYHLYRSTDLVRWLGPVIYEVETRGERVDGDKVIVVREARLLRRLAWNDRTERQFACDCAEHVLGLFAAVYADDDRPQTCIRVSRRFADGFATKSDLVAAEAAAWAARTTAKDDYWAVVCNSGSKDAMRAFEIAAWAAEAAAWAAGNAVMDHDFVATIETIDMLPPYLYLPVCRRPRPAYDARVAAEAAAWAAGAFASEERRWQAERLMGYLYPPGNLVEGGCGDEEHRRPDSV